MRKYEQITVSFVEDLVADVPPSRGPMRSNYYRGHANASWQIAPSLFRADLERTGVDSWLELANSRSLQFKQLAPSGVRSQMSSELEWNATACHHGAPTNFTAWSEAALVALYFATEVTPDETDGALWRMMPGDDRITISQDFEQVPDAPRVYHPQFQTTEMTAQRVCFLTHPFPDSEMPPVSFENYYNTSSDPMHLCKITIPHRAKMALRQHIAALGFDARTIFPGLQGVGLHVSQGIYTQTSSYEWMM